ncbi:MAG: hypothetical protein IJP17_08160, partial [Clostridia bacterium]|nr:hypothetical protein [Clostridia bacterium]
MFGDRKNSLSDAVGMGQAVVICIVLLGGCEQFSHRVRFIPQARWMQAARWGLSVMSGLLARWSWWVTG